MRRRCRAPLRRRHHLAASARLARRPARSDRGCRSRRPRRRHARLRDARRRAGRGRAAPADDLHARGRRLRPQPAQGGAGGRRRVGARSRQRRHRRHAQLHRRHDRQIQGRAPPSPRAELFRHRDPRRLRNSRRSALPRGRADQPRHRHESPARADEGRDRAHAQGVRSGRRIRHDRARADQLHPVRADDDLCPARSSGDGEGRSLLARVSALRGLRHVAVAARRRHRAHRAGVRPALRADRVLSGLGPAQGRARSRAAGAVRNPAACRLPPAR